jgi:hypothetical protein
MKITRIPLFSAVIWTFFVVAVQITWADSITYRLSAMGSGYFGGVPFFNTPFTITAFADTTQISHPSTPLFSVTNASTTISLSGMGSGALLTDTVTLDFQNASASEASAGIFLYYQGPNLLSVFNSTFRTYDLSTSLAPRSGAAGFQQNFLFSTTSGDFRLSSVSSASFTASLQPAPEPGSLGFLGLSIAVSLLAVRAVPLSHASSPCSGRTEARPN